MPERLDTRTSTAYHEAGHAVVAWLYEIGLGDHGIVLHVSADGTSSEEHLGIAHLPPPFEDEEIGDPSLLACRWSDPAERPTVLREVEAYCSYGLAGVAAESIATGDQVSQHGGWGDAENAFAVAAALQYAIDPPFTDAETWLNEVLVPRVERLLRRPDVWATVERCAQALLARGHLSPREFEAVVSEAPPDRSA